VWRKIWQPCPRFQRHVKTEKKKKKSNLWNEKKLSSNDETRFLSQDNFFRRHHPLNPRHPNQTSKFFRRWIELISAADTEQLKGAKVSRFLDFF
jgi:hypothetical protein